MKPFFTRRRVIVWSLAAAIAAGLWIYRWQVVTVVWRVLRPKHQAVAAADWLRKASEPAGLEKAAPLLADVPRSQRPDLVRKAAEEPGDRGLAALWLLALEGSEEALAGLLARAASGKAVDFSAAPILDLAGDLGSRQPVTPLDRRLQDAAARLLAAGSGPPSCKAPSGADGVLAASFLGTLTDALQRDLFAALDNAGWPDSALRKVHVAAARCGQAGPAKLVERLLSHTDPRSRGWAAHALLCGIPEEAARRSIADRLDQSAARAVEPELALQTARALRWTPDSAR